MRYSHRDHSGGPHAGRQLERPRLHYADGYARVYRPDRSGQNDRGRAFGDREARAAHLWHLCHAGHGQLHELFKRDIGPGAAALHHRPGGDFGKTTLCQAKRQACGGNDRRRADRPQDPDSRRPAERCARRDGHGGFHQHGAAPDEHCPRSRCGADFGGF